MSGMLRTAITPPDGMSLKDALHLALDQACRRLEEEGGPLVRVEVEFPERTVTLLFAVHVPGSHLTVTECEQ